MSKPAPGTYIIVNRVLSPKDEMLAITFNGLGKAATVTPTTPATSTQRVRGLKVLEFPPLIYFLHFSVGYQGLRRKNSVHNACRCSRTASCLGERSRHRPPCGGLRLDHSEHRRRVHVSYSPQGQREALTSHDQYSRRWSHPILGTGCCPRQLRSKFS